jgi:uncharacterized protein (DUF4213/DUF364 family)
MTIVEDLLASIETDAPVRHVLVGARCTAVCSVRCGLAATVAGPRPHEAPVRDIGRLHTKSARQLAEYALSSNTLEASIGIAAINSLVRVDAGRAVQMNAFDVIVRHGSGRRVALVGAFPFVPRLRPLVGELKVLELEPAEGEYPASAAGEIVPAADVVALTASALINHTLDHLLSLCSRDAFVIVLGPTAPLSDVLFEHGVTAVAGTLVDDEGAALAAVAEGASFREVPGTRRLVVTMRRESGGAPR